MTSLGSSKKIIDKNKDSELVPGLEIADLVKIQCNLIDNRYQQESKVLITSVPNKQFGQLLTVEPKSLIMLETISAEFSFIEIWFTDQNNRPLEIEDNVNITPVIGSHNNRLLI